MSVPASTLVLESGSRYHVHVACKTSTVYITVFAQETKAFYGNLMEGESDKMPPYCFVHCHAFALGFFEQFPGGSKKSILRPTTPALVYWIYSVWAPMND